MRARSLGELGLQIHITELDVATGSDFTDEEAEEQAQLYGDLLQVCLDSDYCTNFETWGFTDLYTWLGEDVHPLPFDASYETKPAYERMVSILSE